MSSPATASSCWPGARIDPGVRERLLQHKLQKPLEDCVQVVGGVVPERFGPIANALLTEYPLVAPRATSTATGC